MRLIDADALSQYFGDAIVCNMLCKNPMHTQKGCDGNCTYDKNSEALGVIGEAQRIIDNAPTIEAAPVVHGEWIEKTPETQYQYVHPLKYKCSNCGFLAQYNGWRYCPDCGCKIDKEGE